MYKLIEMGSNDTDYQKVLIEEEFEVVIKSKKRYRDDTSF